MQKLLCKEAVSLALAVYATYQRCMRHKSIILILQENPLETLQLT